MTQSILAEFIREGHLASHIRRVRNLYSERRACMIRAIARQFGDALDVFGGQAGLHLVLGLPDYVDDTIVVQEAFVRGVIVRPLSKYYLNQKNRKDRKSTRLNSSH